MIALLLSCALRFAPIASEFQYWSYSLRFLVLPVKTPEEVTILYMDEKSHKDLKQPWDAAWDRSMHGKLIELLNTRGARSIVFDLLFETSGEIGADSDFISAARKFGRVSVGAQVRTAVLNDGIKSQSIVPPFEELRNVVSWGIVEQAETSGCVPSVNSDTQNKSDKCNSSG